MSAQFYKMFSNYAKAGFFIPKLVSSDPFFADRHPAYDVFNVFQVTLMGKMVGLMFSN